jgi:predicted nucleic acid-binding protein
MVNNPIQLIISDANILIDILHGGLVDILFLLPYQFAVSDILFANELRKQHAFLREKGLIVKSLNSFSVQKLGNLVQQYTKPSVNDHSALALAIQEKCILLTGDKDLRIAAAKENIEVHGTIWLMEKMIQNELLSIEKARDAFELMKAADSRLPWDDAEKMIENNSLNIKAV